MARHKRVRESRLPNENRPRLPPDPVKRHQAELSRDLYYTYAEYEGPMPTGSPGTTSKYADTISQAKSDHRAWLATHPPIKELKQNRSKPHG